MEDNNKSIIPMEEDDAVHSSSILYNNHVEKRKEKSKTPSCCISNKMKDNTLQAKNKKTLKKNVKPNLGTPNCNAHKRLKKDVLENNVETALEITTHNISDPLLKVPFELGWKRELVHRRIQNRPFAKCDVYYRDPNNRKYRSLRQIQELLNLSLDDNNLTIKNFSFLKKPFGINDYSKEIIRDAKPRLSKNHSKAVKSKKTPELTAYKSNEKNSSEKMKKVVKNVRKNPKQISKKNSSAVMNFSTTSKHETKDWQTIQFGVALKKTVSSEINDVETCTLKEKILNYEIDDDSLKETLVPLVSFQSKTNIIKHVFKYLKPHELLLAARVCTSWNKLAMDKALWKNVCLKNSLVHDWQKCFQTIDHQDSVSLDTEHMAIPLEVYKFKSFWFNFTKDLKKLKKLKTIKLYKCPTNVVENTIYSLPQLEIINAILIKENTIKGVENRVGFMTLSLGLLGLMTNLTELRLKCISETILTSLPSFENLANLKTLSLTSFASFPKNVYQSLKTITANLECLEIGDGEFLSQDFAVVLEKLMNLKSLRLENCHDIWNKFAKTIFFAIRSHRNLKILELINIKFTSCVEDELGKCSNIKCLFIIPAYKTHVAATNSHLLECLTKLCPTLTHLVWGLLNELLTTTDCLIACITPNPNPGDDHPKKICNNLPILSSIIANHGENPFEEHIEKDNLHFNSFEEHIEKDNLHFNSLEEHIEKDNLHFISLEELGTHIISYMKKGGKFKVIKIPRSHITRVYFAQLYNDY